MPDENHFRAHLGSRQFVSIFLIAFLLYFSSTMLAQTLPVYAHHLGATSHVIGLLSGAFAMCALLVRPVSGQLVDTERHVFLLRIVIALILVSVTGLVFARDVWLLILFRGLNGFAWGVGSTLCMTMASNCFAWANLASGIGIYSLGQTLAQAFAPIIAFESVRLVSFNFLYRFNVLLCFGALVLTFLLHQDQDSKRPRRYTFNIPDMVCAPSVLPALLTLCNSIAASAVLTFVVIFAHSLAIKNVGLFFTTQALAILFTRPIWGRISDRSGLTRVLLPCEALIVSGLLCLSLATTFWHFILAATLLGTGTAGSQPALMSECIKRASASERGKASNTNYIGIDIGMFAGSNVAGMMVALLGYRAVYLIFVVPIIASMGLFLGLNQRK